MEEVFLKKNIFVLLIACVMATLMVGCNNNSSKNTKDEEGVVSNNSSKIVENEKDDVSENSSKIDIDEKDVVSKDSSQNTDYTKGVMTETGFESEYLNLKFTLPEGFVMATEEEINSMMDIGADAMGLDGTSVDYTKLSTVYEMMAVGSTGVPNVSLAVEKLALSNMTVDQYLDALKSQLSNLSNVNYEFRDITSVEIAGQEYKKLDMKVELNGGTMLQSYILRKDNDRMVAFVTTNLEGNEEELNALMAAFSEY